LQDTLKIVASKMEERARLIVSVPNARSRQYKWFGERYAFMDNPNHLHQFTPESLDLLLGKYRFRRIKTVASWPYNSFGYVQSMLNMLGGTHNYLYYRLKRRSVAPSLWLDIVNASFLPLILPVAWILAVMDAIALHSQGVITACYEKTHS